MAEPDVAYFRNRYRAMEKEELVELLATSVARPEELTESALEALRQVAAETGLSSVDALREQNRVRASDKSLVEEKKSAQLFRSKYRTRILGKTIGFVGLLGSLIVLIPSIYNLHVGGIVACIAMTACSIWLVFGYEGD